MKSPLFPLQVAIYEKLKSNISYPVYDKVPDGSDMPYITIGEDTAVDWSTKTGIGHEVTNTVHIWSSYNGMKEAKKIIDDVIRTVTETTLNVEGFFVISANVDMVETLRDPDGYHHGVIRFRFRLQEGED